MSNTIQVVRNTSSGWQSANTVLSLNVIGLETDTDKKKVGNGSTAWNSLPYIEGGPLSLVDNAVSIDDNSTTVAASPPYAAVGTEGRWFNTNDGNTYIDINDGNSSQWVLENPPIVPNYGVDDLVDSANDAITQTQQDTAAAIADVNDAITNLNSTTPTYLPISSGQFTINTSYYVTTSNTFTSPNTTGLSNGNVVAMIKIQGTTPIYAVDGSNNENIIHEDETDTTATHVADSEIKFTFNNGNWEV